MTRTERLAHQEVRAKAWLAAQRQQLAHVQAQRRQAEQKDRTHRWLLVGRMADQAGLFVLDDTTLEAVFTLMGRLALLREPVATLEALRRTIESQPGLSVNGSAEAHASCGPCGASLDIV